MAATSRRALLGAIAVAPFAAGAVAALASAPDAREWQHAVELERSTRNAFEVYHAAYVQPASDKHEALRDSFGPSRPFTPAQKAALNAIDYETPQSHFDDLVGVHHAAFIGLLTMPSPTVAALALKLKMFAEDESWHLSPVAEVVGAMHADAVRLSQGGA